MESLCALSSGNAGLYYTCMSHVKTGFLVSLEEQWETEKHCSGAQHLHMMSTQQRQWGPSQSLQPVPLQVDAMTLTLCRRTVLQASSPQFDLRTEPNRICACLHGAVSLTHLYRRLKMSEALELFTALSINLVTRALSNFFFLSG